ncbi:MAG: penicillin-binding protein 2 [Flavobacteriales bacterium]|nr:penicillin-binding protein 2 [Flavobacteriales bacterium]
MAYQPKHTERMYVMMGIVILVAITFLGRLFYIQVVDESYRLSADNNVLRYQVEFPARGLIYDRNGELLVFNEAAYDLMVTPRQAINIDTAEMCQILGMSREVFIQKLDEARAYSSRKPTVFQKQISGVTYANLQEKLYRMSGFFVQKRTLRKYPQPIAGHLLGYVGEASQTILEQNPYYKKGDYVGISGLEKSYENELRGRKGVRVIMVDVFNREKGRYKEGKYDTVAIAGKTLTSSIDAELQAYGERLMKNKTGAIVAIEPSTGEILALISGPTYDPNLLVGRVRSQNYSILLKDTLKPLFNRALMSEQNPPGSTFKVLNALIGQQVGVLNENTTYRCPRGYVSGKFRMGCHDHRSPLNLRESIQHSCNAYYGNVFRNIIDHTGKPWEGYAIWRDHVMSFGLGIKFNTDLPVEYAGSVPSPKFYDKYYGEHRWKSLTIISMAIGQGELGATPLQLANMTAAIANRGYYYPPHLVKAIDGKPISNRFTEKQVTTINREYFDPVVDGMAMVFQQGGTGYRSRLDSLEMCGKTGTAQNPHGEDHSIFICFAPKDNPKIALAVFVENGGGGSKYGAPIASLMVEKYLRDTISRTAFEKVILDTDLITNPPKKKEKH